MAEDQKGVKLKPKPSLVRLNGSASPVVVGMPGQKMAKLCSFKAPRDLTLGAANAKTPDKKKFVPNLNVVRNVKKEENVDGASNGHAKNQRKRDSVKKEKKDRKEKPQLIQTTNSVFAEGIGADVGGARHRSGAGSGGGGGGGGGGRGREEGGALGLSSEQEEARIRELMRDDFIDDLKCGDRTPVQLPMIDTGELLTQEIVTIVTHELFQGNFLVNQKQRNLH